MSSSKGEPVAAMIEAQDIRKQFSTGGKRSRQTTEVLKGISLSINPGEMVSIVGPSGSGKSTLLYCLSGLETADSGSIRVVGEQLVKASRRSLAKVRRSHLGFIFQSYNLIPSLNVEQNVSLPARLAGRPITSGQTRAALEAVGLGAKGKSQPGDLSGGEQQRVAIARVLAATPKVVFADEPTGALDSKNGREVLSMLRHIANEPERAVVLVTHDLEAASLADRVLVLRDGRFIKELGCASAAELLKTMEATNVQIAL